MLNKQATILLFAAVLTLTSCNMGATPAPTMDINAINTAALATAMGQLSAQQTQAALAAPSAILSPTSTSGPAAIVVALGSGTSLPTANAGVPTFSFNSTPNATPLAGFTAPAALQAKAPTASLGDECSNSVFEGDITIPDGTVLEPGVNFAKTWKIRNTGTCMWDDGYALIFIGGNEEIDPYDYTFSKKDDSDFVAAGEAIDITMNLTAPCTPGKYQGTWRMRNDQGYYFGTYLSVYIEVKNTDKKCGKK